SFTDLGDYLFFARNAEYSIVSTAFENEFLATVIDSQLFPADSTTSPAQAVPEPGTFGLIGFLGFAALVRTRLRRE
ncbi:MAG TPA: PEP-CTERM sorting domain-containing protein, partial [Bryobacteraceae bacterium]|nr:PEP-CTERM sorting domain-containing protein [Bryobacteraceae bacterium]